MKIKKKKKAVRMRGTATHGWGFRKKHKGSGHRGGVGMRQKRLRGYCWEALIYLCVAIMFNLVDCSIVGADTTKPPRDTGLTFSAAENPTTDENFLRLTMLLRRKG